MNSFSPETLIFLRKLREYNERTWFEVNKPCYEALARGPALAFIRAMAVPLAGSPVTSWPVRVRWGITDAGIPRHPFLVGQDTLTRPV